MLLVTVVSVLVSMLHDIRFSLLSARHDVFYRKAPNVCTAGCLFAGSNMPAHLFPGMKREHLKVATHSRMRPGLSIQKGTSRRCLTAAHLFLYSHPLLEGLLIMNSFSLFLQYRRLLKQRRSARGQMP